MYFLGHGCSLSVSQEILKTFVIGKISEYWIIACPEVENAPGRMVLCSNFEE